MAAACELLFGFEFFEESAANLELMFASQLRALPSEIEDVDGHVSLRIDQCDFDVTAVTAQRRGDFVEESRAILRDQFEQSTVGR